MRHEDPNEAFERAMAEGGSRRLIRSQSKSRRITAQNWIFAI